MTENLPSDRATKPGDVLTIRNGMTIEVLNTDAEGRLILADGLSARGRSESRRHHRRRDADRRASCRPRRRGRRDVRDHRRVGDYFADASARSGELLWRMPLPASYEATIDSDVADMKNMGKTGQAGSIAAALLLQRFTDGRPWVHLDIAGPARADASRGYTTKGATAFSARTIVEFFRPSRRRGARLGLDRRTATRDGTSRVSER
jgi:leucyl aminopeptidase